MIYFHSQTLKKRVTFLFKFIEFDLFFVKFFEGFMRFFFFQEKFFTFQCKINDRMTKKKEINDKSFPVKKRKIGQHNLITKQQKVEKRIQNGHQKYFCSDIYPESNNYELSILKEESNFFTKTFIG